MDLGSDSEVKVLDIQVCGSEIRIPRILICLATITSVLEIVDKTESLEEDN